MYSSNRRKHSYVKLGKLCGSTLQMILFNDLGEKNLQVTISQQKLYSDTFINS